MQREEFLQQMWLDYVHQHPDIGGLRLWPLDAPAEYLAILTLNHGPYAMDVLLPILGHFGYRCRHRHAMADRGLLISLLAPPDDSAWLVLAELQLGTLSRRPRERLEALLTTAPRVDRRGQGLLCRGRPWSMPDWATYQALHQAHPLAGWLSVMGPRMHHAGFDCEPLGRDIDDLDRQMRQVGLVGDIHRRPSIFPVSPLLDYRFYPTASQRLVFGEGDEHRITLGGIALLHKQVSAHQERAVELLLPHHTRCEMG